MNRLNHVQSVFARPPPLSLSHTLTHSLPPLHCSASLPASITLSLSPCILCTLACFATLLSFSLFSLCLPLFPVHTCSLYIGERMSFSLSFLFFSLPFFPSLSFYRSESLHIPMLPQSLSASKLTYYSVVILCCLQ